MFTGIFAGITWALETVILGIALGMSPFVSTQEAVVLAPFVSTFLHDLFSALFMLVYNMVRGNLRSLSGVFRNADFRWLVLASAIGGPVGMSGYVLAVNHMGSAIGAVASAVYPAVGTVLACVFLKENVRWYQWIFLTFTLFGVYGLSYSPNLVVGNFWLGLLGAFLCAFGWGIEAVILAKCFRNAEIKDESALLIRQSVSALIHGHVHYDNLLYRDRMVVVTTLSSYADTWAPSCPPRELGTITETAFDVFSIKGNLMKITRFGAGCDRMATLLR